MTFQQTFNSIIRKQSNITFEQSVGRQTEALCLFFCVLYIATNTIIPIHNSQHNYK